MTDTEKRLAELQALSAEIDAAHAMGDHDRAQALTAAMVTLVEAAFGPSLPAAEDLSPAFSKLRDAIDRGDIAAVRGLAQGLDLNRRQGANDTFPLIWAMRSADRSAEMVRALVSAGASADQTTKDGYAALHFVADSDGPCTDPTALFDIVAALVEAGADIEARQHWGWTPLHRAVMEGRPQELKALLRNGANPNAPLSLGISRASGLGLSPLMVAGAETDKVQLLLSYGADPAQPNASGQSAAAYLRAEARQQEAALSAKLANRTASRFDRDYAAGLRRSAALVAQPLGLRH